MAVLVGLVAAVYAAFVVLTAIGGRRRGSAAVPLVLGALGFPLTWVLWYVHDVLVPRLRARTP